ncbi:MAG: GAF domain-containing protein [Candidatus Hydrogenedentes bacterium]|nr:GAF domain-containing protein [Candidatus Hydrogenedentota bacterium]
MLELNNVNIASAMLLLSAVLSMGLGTFVFFRNQRRPTHRAFAWLTLDLSLWALGVFCIIHAHTEFSARFWLIATFCVASFLPATFYHFITYFPYQRFEGSRLFLAVNYVGALLICIGTFTPWYLVKLEVFPDRPPIPHYGPVFQVYGLLVGATALVMFINLFSKLKETGGIQRRQIEHVLFSFFAAIITASLTNVLAPVANIADMEAYGPCFLVLMMGGLAYSMIRYHLLDIWVLASRTTVYAVTSGFVLLTFFCIVSIVHWLFTDVGRGNDLLTATLTALIVSVGIQPLKERVQLFFDRLVLYRRYDTKAFLERISRYATQYVKLDELLEKVAKDIKQTVGVRRIRILVVCDKRPLGMITEYSTEAQELRERNINLDYLLHHVERNPEPLVLEELIHRPSEENAKVAKHLAELDAYLLVPLRTTSGVVGMMTLGEKNTRDIYSREDTEVFSTLAVPLATAIENARLYRKYEELNLHLELIMSNMRGGVIAVDTVGIITTVNEEARELLGCVQPGQGLDALDSKVAAVLRQTLRRRHSINHVEMIIGDENGKPGIPVALSSSHLRSVGEEHLGAMVLIYNMTEIKRLESNVQRADRLSSIGTMAAGMAHEIKNPLQSIKTFTQLLLERYEDADFRHTFTEVVPPEVQRIDTIVTRLLHFARPRPIHFIPQNLQRIIDDVIALVENQLRKSMIGISCEYPEVAQEVTADNQQLHQVFLNLILNAITAMEGCTERRLHIKLYYERTNLHNTPSLPLYDVSCARVEVSDTGCGIPPENMDQLFNPFFTTRDNGSGLGLAVVHGIVTSHNGEIDVASEVGKGTTFTLTFPLAANRANLERFGT